MPLDGASALWQADRTMAVFLLRRAFMGPAMLASLLVIGAGMPDMAHAARKPAPAAADGGPDITVDPAMAGHWLPYSTEAYYQLGALDLQPGTLRFAKGQNFTFTRRADILHLTPERPDKKADLRAIRALCHGKDIARSVVIGLHQQGGQTLLQLAFYAEENGPDAAAAADPKAGACQTISYTRAQPLVL